MKQAIYFLKEEANNIPVSVATYNDVRSVVFPSKEESELIRESFPKAPGNLYVLVEGVVFKLGI